MTDNQTEVQAHQFIEIAKLLATSVNLSNLLRLYKDGQQIPFPNLSSDLSCVRERDRSELRVVLSDWEEFGCPAASATPDAAPPKRQVSPRVASGSDARLTFTRGRSLVGPRVRLSIHRTGGLLEP
jgi:hypothetical protein